PAPMSLVDTWRPPARASRSSAAASATRPPSRTKRRPAIRTATAPSAPRIAATSIMARSDDMNRAVIGAWERVLVLAPHTDDGEFGCGGTMARLVETGADVRYVAFSIATRSLPEGFAADTLARAVKEATAELRIPADRQTGH